MALHNIPQEILFEQESLEEGPIGNAINLGGKVRGDTPKQIRRMRQYAANKIKDTRGGIHPAAKTALYSRTSPAADKVQWAVWLRPK